AWRSRGNQARGTAILRPSVRETISSSWVTWTAMALALVSTAEELIPCLREVPLMFLYQTFQGPQLGGSEAAGGGQGDGAKPELCDARFGLHMDVRRLSAFVAIEEKAIGSYSGDCGQRPSSNRGTIVAG